MLNKIREQLKGLIHENTSQEDLNKIAAISSTIDEAEKEKAQLSDELKSTKNDYIELIKSSGFLSKGNPTQMPEDTKPRTLQEIFSDMKKEETK